MSNLGRVPLGRIVLGRSGGGGNDDTPAFADMLTFTDAASALVLATSLTDTLTFTESATYDLRATRFTDTLSFTEVMAPTSIYLRDTLTFTDLLRQSRNRSISDTLIFIDQVRFPRFVTMSDTVTLTDAFTKVASLFLLTPDTLTFTESMAQTSKRAVVASDKLTFAESMTFIGTRQAWISDPFVFNDGLVIKSRAVGTPTVITVTPPTGGGYEPPPITTAVIRIVPHTVLQSDTAAIVLPSALFNDYVATTNKTIIKRTMVGTYRTYTKTNPRKKYHWSFTVPRPKGDALKRFLYTEGNKELDVEDWEGNRYKMKVVSDSFDFVETRRWEPCGNAMDVTIEFEGVRYA